MACMNFGRNCYYSCPNLVQSTAVAVTGDNLVITIPDGIYANNRQLCLVVSQALPTLTAVYPVVIQIGTEATTYPLRCKKGHDVYSDQICSRKIYCLNVATDTRSFTYIGTRCLPSTAYSIPGYIPIPVAPAPTAVALTSDDVAAMSDAKNVTKTVTTKTVLKKE